MNVVVVSEGPCYPPTAGNRIRTLNLMLRLAPRHRITYICRSNGDPEEARQMRTFLGDHGIHTIVVEHPPRRKAGPMFYTRLAANLLSPLPYSIASHNSGRVRQAMREYAAGRRVDLWQLECLSYADALRDLAGARKIIMAHDVVSLLWQRHYQTERNPLKRWYIKRQWRKFEHFERRIYQEATRVVTVSPEDAGLVRNQFGVTDVDVVENGVDNEYFAAVRGERNPRQILFVGTLESRPNLDAVQFLLEQIFPAVLAQEPFARLCIVGRNPPAALARRLRTLERVELHGNVADVRPFLAQSAVMAVPLRIAGGSRIKILEALASGLPVVSTRVGAEGLCLNPDHDFVQVEDVNEMAGALVRCLRAPDPTLEMAERGRGVVRDMYDWDALAVKLEQVWEKCLDASPFSRDPLGERVTHALP